MTDSFDDIASEARKYRLSLTLAHQFFGQVPERVRKSALANCKNLISFNVGADDAPLIAEQFGWRNPADAHGAAGLFGDGAPAPGREAIERVADRARPPAAS